MYHNPGQRIQGRFLRASPKLNGRCVCGHSDYDHREIVSPLGIRRIVCGQPTGEYPDSCNCDDYRDRSKVSSP